MESDVKDHVMEGHMYIFCFKNCYQMTGPIFSNLMGRWEIVSHRPSEVKVKGQMSNCERIVFDYNSKMIHWVTRNLPGIIWMTSSTTLCCCYVNRGQRSGDRRSNVPFVSKLLVGWTRLSTWWRGNPRTWVLSISSSKGQMCRDCFSICIRFTSDVSRYFLLLSHWCHVC